MFETAINNVEQSEMMSSTESLYELGELQLALVGGGSGIALCE
jgi:hypothetical protein